MLFNFKHIKNSLKPSMSQVHNMIVNGTRHNYINVIENEKKKTAKVVMQRSPVNSFNLEFLEQLISTIKDLESKKYRGLILTSSSPTVFSAGLDIAELFKPNEARFRKFWKSLQDLWKALYVTPLITIAAVNGHAPAGGSLLALSCDHSIMVKSSGSIGLPATKLGILAPKWLYTMYTNAIGFRKTEHAVKLGKIFSPEEALQLNIVDELVESQEDLLPRAEEQLDKWLKIPVLSIQRTKLSLRQPFVDDLISYEEQEVEESLRIILLDETQKTLEKYFDSIKEKKNKSNT